MSVALWRDIGAVCIVSNQSTPRATLYFTRDAKAYSGDGSSSEYRVLQAYNFWGIYITLRSVHLSSKAQARDLFPSLFAYLLRYVFWSLSQQLSK